MSVAEKMQANQAARLLGPGLIRFHALDMIGMPLCMSLYKPPLYAIDFDHQLGKDFVPVDMRCHRAGCLEAWGSKSPLG